MATYLSPGVYVKEIPSGSAPIAGAGTSTAAFIGVINRKEIIIPTEPMIEAQEEIKVVVKEEFSLTLELPLQEITQSDIQEKANHIELTLRTEKIDQLFSEEINKWNLKKEIQQNYQPINIKGISSLLEHEAFLKLLLDPSEAETNHTLAFLKTNYEINFEPISTPIALPTNQEISIKINLSPKSDSSKKPDIVVHTDQLKEQIKLTNCKIKKLPVEVKVEVNYLVKTTYNWKHHPGYNNNIENFLTWEIWQEQHNLGSNMNNVQVKIEDNNNNIIFTVAPIKSFIIKYKVLANQVSNEALGKFQVDNDLKIRNYPSDSKFPLKSYPVNCPKGTFTIKVNGEKKEIDNAQLNNDDTNKKSFITIPKDKLETNLIENQAIIIITVDYQAHFPQFKLVEEKQVKLCTNFNEFKKHFGDFSTDSGQNKLAHAVYGFFNNGGTRCYVVRVESETSITTALENLEAIDDIAIVAAPGITDLESRSAIIAHCEKSGDRFAILDCSTSKENNEDKPRNSSYAAFYYPWIQVLDPATKIMKKKEDGLEEGIIYVPPSGHIAGLYARVDAQRGVHKAPANEVILGALGLEKNISKNQQDGLNPQGINCIRNLNGNIRVWGARTIGGDANLEFKYINVRRVFNYLKKSIDQGTQWTVFEPNSPELWAKIRRNVTAFLTIAWRDGALFGSTPEQAFYVKCDEETNPIDQRDLGQVITQIGVSIVKPAEFVIFNLSQWAGPGK